MKAALFGFRRMGEKHAALRLNFSPSTFLLSAYSL
jgi:hypothetical protein